MNKQRIYEIIEKNAFAKYIGMELIEFEEGYAKGRLSLTPQLLNIHQGMHGGCIYSLADTIAGIAATSFGKFVTTVNGNLNYLLPVQNTQYVNCEAKVVRQGRKVGVYQVDITGDDGQLFANGSFTYYKLNKEIDELYLKGECE